ncbi:MAG: hypothetical protein KY395_08095 [Actinobacteria bacterium]|nr:hypothetical protein [Actinomycetota bacterium]
MPIHDERIQVTPMEPGHFGVQLEEGDVRTSCRVRVTDGFVDDLLLNDVDRERIVKESVGFLLERVPATDIPQELSLDEIHRDFPEYYEELRARLEVA